jgi:signal transduction histidine kinase
MLLEFLTGNRDEILRRARARVAGRALPRPTDDELETGVPLFFDRLVDSFRTDPYSSVGINEGATLHGDLRQKMGFTVGQVVHDYGDLCQVVTQLAIELNVPISPEEFKNLNRCLDDAIAHAVAEHARGRELTIAGLENERVAVFAHELRNLLHTANLAYDILVDGTVAIGGSTGAVLGRSLAGLRELVDRTLAEVRLDAGVRHHERLEIAAFLADIELAGMISARARGVTFWTDRGISRVEVDADRQLLGSALANLLQNAFKFTRAGGNVWLRSRATVECVLIEVQDECGGIPPAMVDQVFAPFQQYGVDKSGLGLGLVITKRAVEAMGGELRARNESNSGCVFTVSLPRLSQSD